MICIRTEVGETSVDLWKQGLVSPQTAATELLVAGLAQWVCFVCDRWQKMSLLCAWQITSQMKIFSRGFHYNFSAYMCPFMTGIHSEKCVARRFRR